jgi:hypothetical protein
MLPASQSLTGLNPNSKERTVKYRVDLTTSASFTIVVDVDDNLDPEEAREAAIDKAVDAAPNGVCAQCSGWRQKWSLEIGDDWDVYKDQQGIESVEKVEG